MAFARFDCRHCDGLRMYNQCQGMFYSINCYSTIVPNIMWSKYWAVHSSHYYCVQVLQYCAGVHCTPVQVLVPRSHFLPLATQLTVCTPARRSSYDISFCVCVFRIEVWQVLYYSTEHNVTPQYNSTRYCCVPTASRIPSNRPTVVTRQA